MSGYLAGKVWHSALDAELKPLAATLADIGDDDGTNIYPSIEFVAWRLSRSRSAVEVGLRNLRSLGVLVVVSEGGGRGKPTCYRLIETKLPKRMPWNEQRKHVKSTGFNRNHVAQNGVSRDEKPHRLDEKPRCLAPETTLPTTYETLVPVRDPSERVPAAKAAATRTRFPDGFSLTFEMKSFAEGNGVLNPQKEFDGFSDFHRSKGNRFVDWVAAWRTWVRQSQRFAAKDGGSNGAFKRGTSASRNAVNSGRPEGYDADERIRSGKTVVLEV